MTRTTAVAFAAGFTGLLLLAIGSAPAMAAMSKDEIKAEVEKTYGVAVLRMREADSAGKPAFAVTVMNKGGNDNRAFQVNTLLIDPDTGHLVSSYRLLPDGQQFSDIIDADPNKQPSDLMQSSGGRPWR